MNFSFKIITFVIAAALMLPHVQAAGNDTENTKVLEEVNVIGTRQTQKLGEERKRRKTLDEQMVQDEYDLVRYDTGVTVVEGGRSGSNGFAIRGVDKDRVAINVDGLPQAESRSSEAFQELFGAYGNFNANRNVSEIENFSEVVITKGADSLKSGGGALGGAVNYKTKSPSDYLRNGKRYYLGVKGGFVGRNSQKFSSITLAGQLGGLEALLVYTHRRGHETKNHSDVGTVNIADDKKVHDSFRPAGSIIDNGAEGVARGKPDPQSWIGKSTLLKAGYTFSPQHYLGAAYEDSRIERSTTELSNLWQVVNYGDSGDVRYREDVNYRRRVGFEYRNTLESGPWDRLTLRVDRQRIDMNTWSWEIPKNIQSKGINADLFHIFRTIRQTHNQAAAEAAKEWDWPNISWTMQYGAGFSSGKNLNNDRTYSVRLYNPDFPTSRLQPSALLVETAAKNRYAYLNNLFRLGSNGQYRINWGLRYDQSSSRGLNNDSYPSSIRALVPGLGESRKHGGLSYGLGLDWAFHNHFSLLAKAGSGFRAPTSDETWLLFPHPDFYLKANPQLKSETARNFELGLAGSGQAGKFRLSGFHTRYKNFIELAYLGGSGPEGSANEAPIMVGGGKTEYLIGAPVWKNQNRSSAYVQGIELSGTWNLNSIGLPKGWYTGLDATYTRGKAKHANGKNYPMNALAPWAAVWKMGYDAPSKKWGAALHLSHTARKKPSDTLRSNDRPDEPFPFARHSRPYTLLDLSAYTQIGKHLTVRAAVNNLTNRRYYSWDALRSIREFGTVNRVDKNTHAGIGRFTSPGRNFNLTLEAKF